MPSFKVNLKWASITEVLPNLFISGVTALKPDELRALNIELIVNATTEVPNLRMADVDRIKLWVDDVDTADIEQHFDLVSDRIRNALVERRRVLVHCVAGVSRSATICLAYLLKYECKTLREAYWLLSDRRPMVRPNLGFWRQLITYEQNIKKSPATVRLVWTTTEPERQRHSSDEHDEPCASEQTLIPDVYMPIVVPRRETNSPSPDIEKENGSCATPSNGLSLRLFDARERHRSSSGQKPRFVPSLDPVTEDLPSTDHVANAVAAVVCTNSLPLATMPSIAVP